MWATGHCWSMCWHIPHQGERCAHTQHWMWAIAARALTRRGGRERLVTDQEPTVDRARRILTGGYGPSVVLGDRKESGRSFNPNICRLCPRQRVAAVSEPQALFRG